MTVSRERIAALRTRVASEWRDRIAPFWMSVAVDAVNGGFFGRIENDLRSDSSAEKGVILNARILWAFSRATRQYGDPAYRETADRACAYFVERFVDREHGGVVWTVDPLGRHADTTKRSYAQAFGIYGLAEYHAATGDAVALRTALDLFDVLEGRCRDRVHDGYFETFERDWSRSADQRLSAVDRDDPKSMNAHLHVVEALAALAGVTDAARVRERLGATLDLFTTHVVDRERRTLRMFFDDDWRPTSRVTSFGHDVEASWLLCEAAETLGDPARIEGTRALALELAGAVVDRGLAADGSLHYEAEDGAIVDDQKPWWVGTEAVVGFVNAWQLGGGDAFFDAAELAWAFLDRWVVDREHGEWLWYARSAPAPTAEAKVSQWKCPYHNGRMCFELDRRLGPIEEGTTA